VYIDDLGAAVRSIGHEVVESGGKGVVLVRLEIERGDDETVYVDHRVESWIERE